MYVVSVAFVGALMHSDNLSMAKLSAWSYSRIGETIAAVFDKDGNVITFFKNGEEQV